MKSLLLLVLCYCLCLAGAHAQWTQKQNYPGTVTEDLAAFSTASNGYVLTSDSLDNFWRFSPATNSWTKMANFPGGKRVNASAFTISGNGYIAGGVRPFSANNVYNDLWVYNEGSDTWTQKASMPGPKYSASGFAIGSKAYVAGGWSSTLYEYDAGSDSWSTKASLPFGPINSAVGFALNGKGYMGTGDNGSTGPLAEFWQYDPGTNTWTRKADFGGGGRVYATGFALNSKGYIGTGYSSFGAEDDDLWEYNATSNTWARMPDMGALGRFDAISFVIGNSGYLGLGQRASGSGGGTANLYDLWQFTPATVSISRYDINKEQVMVYPNPCPGKFSVSLPDAQADQYVIKVRNILGVIILEKTFGKSTAPAEIQLEDKAAGIYFVEVSTAAGSRLVKLSVE